MTANAAICCTSQDKASCLVEGTLIRMADGSVKGIECLKVGDAVEVFNHETGKIETAPLLFINHADQPKTESRVLTLNFSDGSILKIVSDHSLFNVTLNEYSVVKEENVASFVGDFFYKNSASDISKSTCVKLIGYSISLEFVRSFCPVSAFHMTLSLSLR